MSLLNIFFPFVKPYILKDAGNNKPADTAQTLTSRESTAINDSCTPIDSSQNSDGKDDANTIENSEGLLKKLGCDDTGNIEVDIEAKPNDKLVAVSSKKEWKVLNVINSEKKIALAERHGFNNVGKFEGATSLASTFNAEHSDFHSDSVIGKTHVQSNVCKVDTKKNKILHTPSNVSANVGGEDMFISNEDDDDISMNQNCNVIDKVEQHKQSEINEMHASFTSTERQKTLTVSSKGNQAGNCDDVERNKDADVPVYSEKGHGDSSSTYDPLYDSTDSDSDRGGSMVYNAKSLKSEIQIADKTTWTWTDNIEYEDSRAIYLHHGVKYRLDLSVYKANVLKVFAKNCFSLEFANERNKRGTMKEWDLDQIQRIWDGEMVRPN